MHEARRFYWILLHTSIMRLYAITVGISILFISAWLYLWYMPLNRSIQKLKAPAISHSVDVHTNVNITDEPLCDHAQKLPQIACHADQSGISMKRMHVHNNHHINFEGKGTVTQIISFFDLLQKDHQSFQCMQMNMYKDCKDIFIIHMQIA